MNSRPKPRLTRIAQDQQLRFPSQGAGTYRVIVWKVAFKEAPTKFKGRTQKLGFSQGQSTAASKGEAPVYTQAGSSP